MQVFSPGGVMLAAVPYLKVWLVPGIERAVWDDIDIVIAYFCVAQILSLGGYWCASRLLADDGDITWANALKAWGVNLLITGAFVWSFLFILSWIIPAGKVEYTFFGDEALRPTIVICVLALVIVVSRLLVPINIYRFGWCSAIVFFVVWGVLVGAGNAVLGMAMGDRLDRLQVCAKEWSELTRKTGQQPVRVFQAKTAFIKAVAPSEKMVQDQARPMGERYRALQSMYAELVRYHGTLDKTDPAGQGEYERRKARYEELLQNLKREVAWQHPATVMK